MTLERNEYTVLDQFIRDWEGTSTADFAIRAWNDYRTHGEELDDFVVICVHGFFAVTKITDGWEPICVSRLVQPFDEKRVYPLQKVKKEISWD